MRTKSQTAWETAARCATLAQEADDPQEHEHYTRLRDAWITLSKVPGQISLRRSEKRFHMFRAEFIPRLATEAGSREPHGLVCEQRCCWGLRLGNKRTREAPNGTSAQTARLSHIPESLLIIHNTQRDNSITPAPRQRPPLQRLS